MPDAEIATNETAAAYRTLALKYLRDTANPLLQPLAVAYYRKALALEPDNIATLLELGVAYRKMGDFGAALACCEEALALDPESVAAWMCRCVWQLPLLQTDVAGIEQSRRNYHARLLQLADFLEQSSPERLLQAARGEIVAGVPGWLPFQGYDPRELHALYGNMLARVMAAAFPQWAVAPPTTAPAPGERIRVGLATPCISDNAHWRMMIRGWIGQLDPSRFALYTYSLQKAAAPESAYVHAHSEKVVEAGLELEEWCATIRADNLHVLLYSELGVGDMAQLLAGLRLAPVQCVGWCNPITSGMPTVDYFLSGELGEPAEAQQHYTEELIRLPNLAAYLEPVDWVASDETRADFGLREDAFVYLCTQWLGKYLPQHDTIFPRIAAALPQSQFVFSKRRAGPAIVRLFEQRLQRAFAAYGLDWQRHIVMVPAQAKPGYHRLCQLSDVFLDSLSFSGGTSTVESVPVHDMPVVTHAGEFFRGRQTLAMLRRMGVTETIANSVDEYIELAVRLGRDKSFHRRVAERIAENKHKVFRDTETIAGLEAFLERVAGSIGRTAA